MKKLFLKTPQNTVTKMLQKITNFLIFSKRRALLPQTLWWVTTTLVSLFHPVKGLAIANVGARKIAFFDEKIVIFCYEGGPRHIPLHIQKKTDFDMKIQHFLRYKLFPVSYAHDSKCAVCP